MGQIERLQTGRQGCRSAEWIKPRRLRNADLSPFGMIACTGGGMTSEQSAIAAIKAEAGRMGREQRQEGVGRRAICTFVVERNSLVIGSQTVHRSGGAT